MYASTTGFHISWNPATAFVRGLKYTWVWLCDGAQSYPSVSISTLKDCIEVLDLLKGIFAVNTFKVFSYGARVEDLAVFLAQWTHHVTTGVHILATHTVKSHE